MIWLYTLIGIVGILLGAIVLAAITVFWIADTQGSDRFDE